MKTAIHILSLLLFVGALETVQSSKILGIFHVPGPSHYIIGGALFKELAKKGHEVTVITPFPHKTPLPNLREIEVESLFKYIVEQKDVMVNAPYQSIPSHINSISHFCVKLSELALEHPNVQKLLKDPKEHFDVVIIDPFFSDALFGIAAHFKAPIVLYATATSGIFNNYLVANPAPYAYVPNVFLPLPDRMNFWQRLHNAAVGIYSDIARYFLVEKRNEEFYRKMFPNGPPLSELKRNVSLLLTNSDVSIETPRPFLSNVKQVGGIHIQKPEPLPEDINKYLNEAKEGVIYFSLGSNLRSSEMPELLETVKRVFSRMPQKVLMKYEKDEWLGKPANVKVGKWLPQKDILAHPNVKVFVTHGGLLSTTESVYNGVPVVGIPFFGDQRFNMENAAAQGFGIKVDFSNFNENDFFNALNNVLNDPKYKEVAETKSKIMRDRPLPPMDEAVFWVEYVIRHRGAYHLRSAGVYLSWCQHLLLDVIGFVSIVLIAGILAIFLVFRQLLKRFCECKSKKKSD